jgi:hypothetical protein
LSHLILSDLSENNNKSEIVQDLFSPFAGDVNITIASRYQESKVYHIQHTGGDSLLQKSRVPFEPVQFELF